MNSVNMIKAIFFDLDNTLCDSDSAWNIAVKETFQHFRKHFHEIPEEIHSKAWMKVHRELFQQLDAGTCSMAEVRDSRFPSLFKELNLPTSKLADELNEFLCDQYITRLRLYEDVSVLEKLQAYHLGIITNGAHDEHRDSQLTKVRNLGLTDLFQSLTISDEIEVRKPNIEIFKVACDRADVLPKEVVMVGDSIPNDIVGANRAGMTSILINRNADLSLTNLADEKPDFTISNLYDVMVCLECI